VVGCWYKVGFFVLFILMMIVGGLLFVVLGMIWFELVLMLGGVGVWIF